MAEMEKWVWFFFFGGFGLCEVEEEGSGLEIGKRKVWFWSDQY